MSDSASVKARLGPAFFGHLPHWATARAVASKPAAELTAAEFKKQAVPLLIKGATEAWPAAERWKDPGYLVQSTGSSLVTIRDIGADVDANRRVSLAEYLELLEQTDGVYMGPTPNPSPENSRRTFAHSPSCQASIRGPSGSLVRAPTPAAITTTAQAMR